MAISRHPLRLLLWAVCLLAAAVLLVLAALPVGRDANAAVSLVIVAVAFLFGRFTERSWHARTVTVLLLAFITLRYFLWRIDGTLPPVENTVDFAAGAILLAAEMLTFAMFFLSLFVILDPLRRTPKPPVGDPASWPTVDVLIPSYSEDAGLLETTLGAALALDYPRERFRVYLLDDGGTDQKIAQDDPAAAAAARERRAELSALCARLGCEYIARDRNVHAKAGNINYALTRTTGEYVLILDADHAPTVDFLRSTVGFLQEDPGLFLVQTPHFFINPDPVEYNLHTFDRMPSENDMFYYSIQPGLDRWNASFFCGSAALLRRVALEEIGGIATGTITEDCETSLELHARGWRSAYLPRPMVAGLQPVTFASFIAQRSRWAQGMMQIFLLKNPLFKRGLTLPQRLCYTNTMIFWFFWFWRPVFTLAPLCYAFFGLEIFRIDLHDFLCLVLPHIVSALFLSHLLHGRTRWPLFSELYEYVQSLHVGRAVIAAMINPRRPVFKVTAKDEAVADARFSELAGPFVVVALLLLGGLATCVWRYFAFPEQASALLPITAWNTLSFILAVSGVAVVYERRRARRQDRVVTNLPGALTLDDGTEIPVTVRDVSAGGLGLVVAAHWRQRLAEVSAAAIAVDDPLDEQRLRVSVRLHRRQVKAGELLVGVGFAPTDRDEMLAVSRLVFGNSSGWEAWIGRKRTNRPNLLLGFAYFIMRVLPRGAVALAVLARAGARRLANRHVPEGA
ncbi:UDP-forming cellulose synthase catalytic subunit [Azospirillum sp. ST 5-10]|uniref:UDP-forming cellulose synthase catalytic subunit n=1 Tax=unclassified Azospirillum TaxID=2630922 RepID=UPI003F49EB31